MINKLEKIKQLGHYSVSLIYGEDIGCDDSGLKIEERTIKIIMSPVGYVGELRKLWKGKYLDLLKFDFSAQAKTISNPPKREELENDGYYIWGTDVAIKSYEDKFN